MNRMTARSPNSPLGESSRLLTVVCPNNAVADICPPDGELRRQKPPIFPPSSRGYKSQTRYVPNSELRRQKSELKFDVTNWRTKLIGAQREVGRRTEVRRMDVSDELLTSQF